MSWTSPTEAEKRACERARAAYANNINKLPRDFDTWEKWDRNNWLRAVRASNSTEAV